MSSRKMPNALSIGLKDLVLGYKVSAISPIKEPDAY